MLQCNKTIGRPTAGAFLRHLQGLAIHSLYRFPTDVYRKTHMNDLYQNLNGVAKSNFNNFQAIAQHLLGGMEQVGQLNLAVSKAVAGESLEHVQSLLDVRDAQQFITMQAGAMQPMAEKSASYLRQIYDIVSSTNAEIGKLAEGQMQEVQQNFTAMMDSAMKNAPAGTEAATAMFRNAFNASQDAINSAQSAARQAVATTEQNMSAMSDQAVSTVRSVSARSKR